MIKTVEHDTAGKYRAAKNNRILNFPQPRKWRLQDERIRDAQAQLAANDGITIDEFLHRVAHYRNFNLISKKMIFRNRNYLHITQI